MALHNEAARYGSVARLLHWTMAIVVIATLVVAEARGYAPRGSAARRLLAQTHYQIGVAIFALIWIRLAWRLRQTEPAIQPPLPAWQRAVSHAVAWLFYALMIALPVLGVLAEQSDGHAVTFLGWTLPTFISPDRALSRDLETVHRALGTAMIWLVLLHIVAALYHALVRKDDALSRMIGAR